MARQLMAVLEGLGHDVRLASRLRSWMREPDALPAVEREAAAEIARLGDAMRDWRPDAWFTYHLYHRAPDLIGPAVSRALGIPYCAAEASHAPKRARDGWARAHGIAEDAILGADLLFAMTARDAAGLEKLPGRKGALARLPPFLEPCGPPPLRPRFDGADVRLVTVAMMREGGKLANYRILAEALAALDALPWTLTVIGDGAARPAVERAFAGMGPGRVHWLGRLTPEAVVQALAEADLFVWPGQDEPYGMVYLEAAGRGLPVAAMASGGVPDVVRHGETGLLAPYGDLAAFRSVIERLIREPGLRTRLGEGGRRFVVEERSGAAAGRIIAAALAAMMVAEARP